MTEPITIAIPCRRFGVHVTLSASLGLSQLERFVLESVANGVQTVDTLRGELSVSPRMLLDACIDMLDAGYLAIDPAHGTLHLSEDVAACMGNPQRLEKNWHQTLRSAAPPEPRKYELVQERISGAVFPYRRQPYELRRNLPRAPHDPELPSLEHLTKSDLLLAVLEKLRCNDRTERAWTEEEEAREIRMMREGRVSDVTLARETGSPTGAGATRERNFMLYVRMIAHISQDGEPPRIAIVGPSWIPATTRRRMEAGLIDLWQRGLGRAEGQFFARISYVKSALGADEYLSVTDPYAALARFDEALDQLDGRLASEDVKEVHELLTTRNADLRVDVEQAVSYSAVTRLVFGAAEHHDLALRALQQAEQQVVLACPWVSQLAAHTTFREAITGAVERGVLVHLIWGIGGEEEREKVFGAALAELLMLTETSAQGGRLILPEQSSRHHAKLIVCDLDWAVVTSCNFLNAPRLRAIDEVGVHVSAPQNALRPILSDERHAPARAIIDLLDWTRRVLPQYELRRQVQRTPVLFGRRDITSELAIGAAITVPGNEMAHNVWKHTWKQRSGYYRKLLEDAEYIVIPACDDENRRLLVRALESSQQRLIISSPELGRGILGAVPTQALLKLRLRGVDIAIYYQQWSRSADFDVTYRSRFAELERAKVRFVRIESHAKILICDDWAVVGSFNFLSFEGGGRGELGLRLLSKDLADKLASHLSELGTGAG